MGRALPLRRRPDTGSVMIEVAFVLPIVLFLFFAVIEFGLFFAARSTSVAATRDGARFGSANFAVAASKDVAVDEIRKVVEDDLEVQTGFDTPEVLWIYQADPDGGPIGGSGFGSCPTSCYRFTWDGTQFVLDDTSPGWASPDLCIPTLDSIGVYLKAEHRYLTGVLGDQTTIEEHTVLRLEPLPLNQCPSS